MRNAINQKIKRILELFTIALVFLISKIGVLGARDCAVGIPSAIINKTAKWDCGVTDNVFDSYSDCFWFSKALRVMFELMGSVSSKVYDGLAGLDGSHGIIPLMGACFAIWMAWHVMRYVSVFYAQSPADFAMLIGTGLFRLLVAVCLIKWGAGEIFDLFIGNFVTAAANVGTEIMSSAGITGSSTFTVAPYPLLDDGTEMPVHMKKVMDLHAAIAMNIKTATSSFLEVQGIGKVLFHYSFEDGWECLVPSSDPFWTGLVLMAAGAVLAFLVPFKFIDIIFRLTLIYALMPLFIMAWVFPSTRKYTVKAWGIVVYAVCLMLIMSVLFALCTSMISSYLFAGDMSNQALAHPKNLYMIFRTDENCDKNALFTILVILFISVKVLGTGKELSGHFSDSDGGSAGEGVLGTMTGAVGGAAVATAGSAARWGVGKAADRAGKILGGVGGLVATGGAGLIGMARRKNSLASSGGDGSADKGDAGGSGGGSGSGSGSSGSNVANNQSSGASGSDSSLSPDIKAKLENMAESSADGTGATEKSGIKNANEEGKSSDKYDEAKAGQEDTMRKVNDAVDFASADIASALSGEEQKAMSDLKHALEGASVNFENGLDASGNAFNSGREAKNQRVFLEYGNFMLGYVAKKGNYDADMGKKILGKIKSGTASESDRHALERYFEKTYGEDGKKAFSEFKGQYWAKTGEKLAPPPATNDSAMANANKTGEQQGADNKDTNNQNSQNPQDKQNLTEEELAVVGAVAGAEVAAASMNSDGSETAKDAEKAADSELANTKIANAQKLSNDEASEMALRSELSSLKADEIRLKHELSKAKFDGYGGKTHKKREKEVNAFAPSEDKDDYKPSSVEMSEMKEEKVKKEEKEVEKEISKTDKPTDKPMDKTVDKTEDSLSKDDKENKDTLNPENDEKSPKNGDETKTDDQENDDKDTSKKDKKDKDKPKVREKIFNGEKPVYKGPKFQMESLGDNIDRIKDEASKREDEEAALAEHIKNDDYQVDEKITKMDTLDKNGKPKNDGSN